LRAPRRPASAFVSGSRTRTLRGPRTVESAPIRKAASDCRPALRGGGYVGAALKADPLPNSGWLGGDYSTSPPAGMATSCTARQRGHSRVVGRVTDTRVLP